MEAHGFCFLFAPAYHPAFKAIMPVRKALAEVGRKTVFNLIGPLINPARPAHQLMGVYGAEWVSPIASTLAQLGRRKAWVVHSICEGQALDELAVPGEACLSSGGTSTPGEEARLSAFVARLRRGALADLKGGNPELNRSIFRQVVEGRANPVLMDTLYLNAAVAFWSCGLDESPEAGFERAREVILSGKLRQWLLGIQHFFGHGA
jgi:anthranilate phosphoribosyltransferase